MSGKVVGEVFDQSRAEDAAFVVLLAIADNADHRCAIAWPGQAELVRKSRRSERAVRDGLRQLEQLGEVETRQARRGRVRFNVYRVTVGRYRDVEIDDAQLPFSLIEPFSRPAAVAGRQVVGLPGAHDHSPTEQASVTTGNGRRPSNGARPAESGADDRQRAPRRPAESSSSTRARGTTEPSEEPSREPSAAAAAVAEQDLAEQLTAAGLRGELDLIGAGARLRQLALADPERALAWIQVAKTDAERNPAGYVLAGLESGEWPSVRGRLPGATEFDRCRAWINQTGCRLDPEDARFHLDEWDNLGDVERQELTDLLDQAIAARQQTAAEAAA